MSNAVRTMITTFLGINLSVVAAAAFADQQTTNDGIYTESQATAGQAVYEEKCKTCHPLEFYQEKFKVWNKQPLIGLFDSLSATMPGDRPGGLMIDEYTNVLAYIFSVVGYPAGEQALNPDDGSMEEIIIEAAP